MLDSEMKERASGTMKIEDLSPKCVKILLKWIYTGVLDEDWKKFPEEMVRAADKYGLSTLLDFFDKHLQLACNFDNALDLRRLAKLHGLAFATRTLTTFISKNTDQCLEGI